VRTLERNKQTFYYSLYDTKGDVKDEYGNKTGEVSKKFSSPIKMKASISPPSGASFAEQFGKSIQYDKVIITDDMNCPIDENSILFVDNPPTYNKDGDLIFDYIVKKVAKSLNCIAYAISKVDVS